MIVRFRLPLAIALATAILGSSAGDVPAAKSAGRRSPLPAIPLDSTAARQTYIRESPPAVFAVLYDSLLMISRPPVDAALLAWAGDYLGATGDSLLLRDSRWAAAHRAPLRATWFRGVQADRDAGRLQASKNYAGAAARFGDAVTLYRSAGDLRREAVALGSQ